MIKLKPGEKINIVGRDQAEDADFVVCVRVPLDGALILADNCIGPCVECGHQVQFRPTAPARPPRLCVECAVRLAVGDDVKQSATAEAVAEALLYHADSKGSA